MIFDGRSLCVANVYYGLITKLDLLVFFLPTSCMLVNYIDPPTPSSVVELELISGWAVSVSGQHGVDRWGSQTTQLVRTRDCSHQRPFQGRLTHATELAPNRVAEIHCSTIVSREALHKTISEDHSALSSRSVCLSVCLSVRPSVCLPVCQSIC